jgi:hypothetical protein
LWHIADIAVAPAFVRYWSNSGHWPKLAQNGSVAIDPKRTSAATTTQNLIMSVVVSVVLSAITGALTKSHVMYCSM